MTWTTASDLRAQVQRLWDRGELLRATVSDTVVWPLRLTLKSPSAAELTDQFDAVRAWVGAIATTAHVRIEWREWNHRIQGAQRLPASVWVDNVADALAGIGKTRQAQRFDQVWDQTAKVQPALLEWLLRQPLLALEHADRWDRLLSVVVWLQENPRPGIYLRQVDVPGVDSKFIETHRAVLTKLLDLALAPEAIEPSEIGAAQFAKRFGFLDKPQRIRFRLLDPSLLSLPGCVGPLDIALDAASFAVLALPVEHVFITENETNYLTFPPVQRGIVIFGAGYGWDALAQVGWLHQRRLHYWGDIDTHGFAILDQLRAYLPTAKSFLMDRKTLLAHRLHWCEEPTPARQDLPRLTTEEAEVFDDLRFDRIQLRLRLEQERVGYRWIEKYLDRLPGFSVPAPIGSSVAPIQ